MNKRQSQAAATSVKEETRWYNLDIPDIFTKLGTQLSGLPGDQAKTRLAQFGPNELKAEEKKSLWSLFLEQFKSVLIIILLIAVALSAALGEVVDAAIIGVIILFACSLGFIQEYRAERAMEALRKMAAPIASVKRDRKEVEIPARELVPGDILILRTGNRISADARIIENINLRTEEAPLTGESLPVEKTTAPIGGEVSVGDRRNMVFTGTAIVYGRGTAVVTSTGMNTEFGKIAGMLQTVKTERTPLQINLDRMGKWIAIVGLVLCFLIAGLGYLRGHEIMEMFIWGIALAVAAVPEALPAVVVISLALGVRRMAKRNALIRRLPAVETLGSTTFICSDKTGTLTQDQMTIKQIFVNGRLIDVTGTGYEPKGEFFLQGMAIPPGRDPSLQTLLQIGILCNDTSLSSVNGTWQVNGDPTEGALVVAAVKGGLLQNDIVTQFPALGKSPSLQRRKE